MTDPIDYKDTVFLPKTDFPMKAGLPAKEPGILAKWQAADQYRTLRNRRKGREKFILHDGPPYANGDMHIGHALNHILKDMVVRTQTLLGKDAPYVPGWDCHGLPIEWKVEEEYRKKKLNKDEVPVREFRAECRAYAQKWVDVQREQLKRLGIGGDWDNPYLTMDFAAEATIVTELMKFAESGQLYRGAKPVMWSPVEKTALAEAEVEYEDIVSTQIDVGFEIVESPIAELVGAYAVIWTTTPWTIPVNQAIAYGADVEYVAISLFTSLVAADDFDVENGEFDNPLAHRQTNTFVVAEALVDQVKSRFLKSLNDTVGTEGVSWEFCDDELIWRGKGSDLAGTMARHPMWHLDNPPRNGEGDHEVVEGAQLSTSAMRVDGTPPSLRATSPFRGGFYSKPRPFLDGSAFVTTETGTGLVHLSPDHGEDDFDLCKAHGIDPVFAVQGDGKYREDWAWVGGEPLSVINNKLNAPPNADGTGGRICEDLKAAGALLSARNDESTKHSYPHSWRSKAKVIYRCTPQWFVAMDRELVAPAKAGAAAGAGSQGVIKAPASAGATLRETALAAISATRWVPEKGRNRINSMVEGRPDWVLSRQRAWGVPITLFVDRKTGQYLSDEAVNARIIAGIRAEGVDAWCDENAKTFLGESYDAADYERVVDILDVWFDSGCTHAFVLESGKWPDLVRPADHVGPWADLYLEGSDQHRGWFQSSLLESCGTRGRAPYKAVLTHGFTMDQKGMKMSKSLGNTISPTDLMRDSGADILRLWALSVDFTEDHRIGKEILSGVSDQYRKLRNTFRYLLGALEGFSDAEKVPVADMPELERYVLHLLADMDGKLRQAVEDFDFNTYVRLITDFANNDLSAFFFDIRKDSLYCDAATNPKRMAYRTVLDILFHALVRYAAPVLVFTAEEVWQTRFPAEGESVHYLEWPEFPKVETGPNRVLDNEDEFSVAFETAARAASPQSSPADELAKKWSRLRDYRSDVTEAIEPLRRDKLLGSGLQAQVQIDVHRHEDTPHLISTDLSELFIVGQVELVDVARSGYTAGKASEARIEIEVTAHHKCGRCWRHLPEVADDGTLCNRCEDVVNG
jgi:isoleucyl-tRNA synthetase